MKKHYLAAVCSIALFSGCAVVNDVKMTQTPYHLPNGITDTARVRVSTDAIIYVYPAACADASVDGSGVGAFHSGAELSATVAGNDHKIGMPAGHTYFQNPMFTSSELTVPADRPITVGYNYKVRAANTITTCRFTTSFTPIKGHNYEVATYIDTKRNRCVNYAYDIDAKQDVAVAKVTARSCPVNIPAAVPMPQGGL